MALSELDSLTKIAQQTVQTVAIVAGGAWAYFKFIRGRLFHHRAELNLAADLVKVAESTALKVRLEVKNAGASQLPIASCEVIASVRSGTLVQKWTRVANSRTPIIRSQIVESQETVAGQELVEVPAPYPEGVGHAYRVRAEMLTERRRFREAQVRFTDAIVTVGEREHCADRLQ